MTGISTPPWPGGDREGAGRLIYERTKAALAIRKASGGKLGNPITFGKQAQGRASLGASADENARNSAGLHSDRETNEGATTLAPILSPQGRAD